MPFPSHGSAGFSYYGGPPPHHSGGSGLSGTYSQPFGHGKAEDHHTHPIRVEYPSYGSHPGHPIDAIAPGYYHISNLAHWNKHTRLGEAGSVSGTSTVATGSLGRCFNPPNAHANAGDKFIKSTGFQYMAPYDAANDTVIGNGWVVKQDARNKNVTMDLLGGEPVVIELANGKQIIGLDDFALPSWTEYPSFYQQSENSWGGHHRYVSWMDEYGTGKRVPWKFEPVEFTEAEWRKQFNTTDPMPKDFKCYRIVNADHPSDGWFYYPPTITVDEVPVHTPGFLMYGNAYEICQGLAVEIATKKIKFPEGYEFAYDSHRAQQLGMFHFGG
ncbi:hypothetical protein MD484_g3482, partial [Candolleomyces efflorescens]